MQKIQFEGIDAKQKCSKQNKMISNKRLHSATYLRLQLVILLCLLPSEVMFIFSYFNIFPRIGENGVTGWHDHCKIAVYKCFFVPLRKRNLCSAFQLCTVCFSTLAACHRIRVLMRQAQKENTPSGHCHKMWPQSLC